MYTFKVNTAPKHSLSSLAICNEIENEHQRRISQGCNSVIDYLRKHEHIENALPSVSELVHINFYKLNYEIKQCFAKEKQELYPLIVAATVEDRVMLTQALEPFKGKHELILKLVNKVRQLLWDYVAKPEWSEDFKSFINELFSLENNIHAWIYVEEDLLFSKIITDLEKTRHISTVFR